MEEAKREANEMEEILTNNLEIISRERGIN